MGERWEDSRPPAEPTRNMRSQPSTQTWGVGGEKGQKTELHLQHGGRFTFKAKQEFS